MIAAPIFAAAALATAGSQVVAKVPTGGQPCGIAEAAGSIWVTDATNGKLLRVDPSSNTIQLAATYCEAVGWSEDNSCTFDPTPSSNPADDFTHIDRNVISITRPSLSDPAHPSNLQALRPAPINPYTPSTSQKISS